jgi:hypothetical protein
MDIRTFEDLEAKVRRFLKAEVKRLRALAKQITAEQVEPVEDGRY